MSEELAVSRKRIRSNDSDDNRQQAKLFVDQKMLEQNSNELMQTIYGNLLFLNNFWWESLL